MTKRVARSEGVMIEDGGKRGRRIIRRLVKDGISARMDRKI